MSYFIVSDVVLRQMYRKANYSRMQWRYIDEIRKLVRGLTKEVT